MPNLVFKEELTSRDLQSANDIERIVNVCGDAGFTITPRDARRAWEATSESSSANWLNLPDEDDFIVAAVTTYCDVR